MFGPLNNKTHYSLLSSLLNPSDLVDYCIDNDFKACGITDIWSISSCVNFYNAMKEAGIKPVLGCDFNGTLMYAKNLQGWKDLIKIVSGVAHGSENIIVVTRASSDKLAYYHNKFGSDNIYVHSDLALPDFRYTDPSRKDDYKLVRCIKENTPFAKYNLEKNDYWFHDKNAYSQLYSDEQIKNTEKLIDRIEDFNILNKPLLPDFACPSGMSQSDYLKELCRNGWRKRNLNRLSNQEEYKDRVLRELDVINRANLSGYFLIVQDIVNWAKAQGWLCGPGRGSAAGCLISYLIGITEIDPLKHDLMFERFYNEGRNSPGKISLPDIDSDFPINKRQPVIDRIKEVYGASCVSHIATFGGLQGRGAMTEVLRLHQAVAMNEIKRITEVLPAFDKISDKLEAEQENSIIRWTLRNEPDLLSSWCRMSEDENCENQKFEGDLAQYFEQAIRIEGLFKTRGVHASGIIVCNQPISNICPVEGGTALIEMNELESLGLVKLDILGVAILDKLMRGNEL